MRWGRLPGIPSNQQTRLLPCKLMCTVRREAVAVPLSDDSILISTNTDGPLRPLIHRLTMDARVCMLNTTGGPTSAVLSSAPWRGA